jgi:hypothetical protein
MQETTRAKDVLEEIYERGGWAGAPGSRPGFWTLTWLHFTLAHRTE